MPLGVKQYLPAYYSLPTNGFPGNSDGKESTCIVEALGSIPGLRRFPREGNGTSLQYSCLENSMDRGVRWATMKSQRVRHDWATNTFFHFSGEIKRVGNTLHAKSRHKNVVIAQWWKAHSLGRHNNCKYVGILKYLK